MLVKRGMDFTSIGAVLEGRQNAVPDYAYAVGPPMYQVAKGYLRAREDA